MKKNQYFTITNLLKKYITTSRLYEFILRICYKKLFEEFKLLNTFYFILFLKTKKNITWNSEIIFSFQYFIFF